MKKFFLLPLFLIFFLSQAIAQVNEKQFAGGIDLALLPSISFGVSGLYNINSQFAVKGNLGLSGSMKVTGIFAQYKIGNMDNKQAYIYAMVGSMSHNSASKGTFGLGIGVNYFIHPQLPLYGMLEVGYISIPDYEDVVVGIPLSISAGLKYGFSLY